MKLARIYIKPVGEKWVDLPLRPEQDLGIVFQVMRTEGVIIQHNAFCIPAEQVHHMTILEVPDPPAGHPMTVWQGPGGGEKPN